LIFEESCDSEKSSYAILNHIKSETRMDVYTVNGSWTGFLNLIILLS